MFFLFQEMQNFICAQHHFVGHACKLRDMNSKTVLASAFLQLPHENDFVPNFFYRHIEILYAH